jgi:hypothetical protein
LAPELLFGTASLIRRQDDGPDRHGGHAMTRRVLGLLTAAALAATGLALLQSGRLTPRAAGSPAVSSRPDDPLASDYGRRFLRNQPLHWRDVVLPR